MQEISIQFRDAFEKAFRNSKFTSYRQLSLASQCSEPQAQQIIKGKFDGSNTGPGIFTMYRLARSLGISLDSFFQADLAPPTKNLDQLNNVHGREPTCYDALMSIHWRSGGRLEAFDEVQESFDLYAAPNDETIKPVIKRIGAEGLLCMRMQTTDISIAQRELDALPPQLRRQVLDFHRRVMTEGMCVENTFLDHRLKSKPVHVRAGYSKLGLRVEGQNDRPYVLLACKPIPV